jgi:hypothetical protein
MQTILNNIEGLVSKGDKKGQANTFPDIIKNLSDLINETQKSTRVKSTYFSLNLTSHK